MDRALVLAARGRGRTSPSPMVGAVVVSADDVVVGHGFLERAGAAHAEVRAIRMAGADARGGTLYSTFEPCSCGRHAGAGPCVTAIVAAGIARVVTAVEDPNPLFAGQGVAYLRAHGVAVDVGLRAGAAARLNEGFFTLTRERRPFVILKAALSIDGGIADAPGRQTSLTSTAANRHAHAVRAEVDAIGVGVGTILVDDPWLTARGAFRERPLVRVVFDRRLRTPPSARVLSTRAAGPVIIVTTPAAAACVERRRPLEARGAEIEVAEGGGVAGIAGINDTRTLRGVLTQLGARQIQSLLLEGGALLHQAAWDAGVVDFVRLYVTPRVLGPGAVRFLGGRAFDSAALHRRRVVALGPDVLVEGYVHGSR